jgi:hypothetical protein
MRSFLNKFSAVVRGVLSGLDRVFFRGTLRSLAYTRGLEGYLWVNHIPFKDFADHALQVTTRLQEASLRKAQELGREVRYLNSAQLCKEDIAREIAARDRIKSGLICVLRSVDPCLSAQVVKNHQTKRVEVCYRLRKCMHLYHYQIHPVFGFMHARIQTWFPFTVHVCLNGWEWLARQMDQARLHYCKRDNTFFWLEDLVQTQALFDQQLKANWPELLGGLAEALNPIHGDIFAKYPCRYYWSVIDSEWASDVMFRSRAALEKVYPRLLHHAVTTFGTVEVLRFLGQPVSASGKVPHRCRHEVVTNLTERVEGTRLKHWLNGNSIKIYDKGSVLRTECTLRQPGDFKVYRSVEGDPDGTKDWRQLRLGIADMHRRGEVCQAANERYLDALAAVHDTTPLRQLAEPLSCPAPAPVRSQRTAPAPGDATGAEVSASTQAATRTREARPRRVRALNPLAPDDAALLETVSRHEFLINGLRNRDLRRLRYGADPNDPIEQRRRAAAVTRQLRLLRAHRLIHKVPKTHRYMVSERGRQTLTALLAARNASVELLTRCVG